MNRFPFLLLPGLTFALAGGAFAQGDLCSNATPLNTLGSFAYDTTGHSTSGFDGGGSCASFIQNFDGFFQWTAPAAGDFVFDTFGTTYDTTLALHAGLGCSATCIAFNDDFGSLQSQAAVLGVAAGAKILVQVSGFSDTTDFGPGILNIQSYINPCTGSDDGFENNDTCASPSALTAGSYTGLYVTAGDSDFYSITIPTGMVLHITETFDSNSCDYNLWDTGCGNLLLGGYSTEVIYTNTSGSPRNVVLEAQQWTGATLLCSDYDIDVAFSVDPCATAVDDGFEDNDNCTSATNLGAGTYTGLAVLGVDVDHYRITIPTGQILSWTELFDSNDTTYDVWDNGCGTKLLFDQFLGFNFSNTTGAPQTVVVQAYQNPASPQPCSDYDITISFSPDPCQGVPDDTLENNDSCSTAVPITDATYFGLFVSLADKDYYSFCVPSGGTVDCSIYFSMATADLNFFLWNAQDANCGSGIAGLGSTELAAGFSATDDETLTWTNTTGTDVQCILEVDVYPYGFGECNDYELFISGTGGCTSGNAGTPFCSPMNPNSTGASTTMTGSMGTGVGAGLHLEASSGPPNQFGYFLIGTGVSVPGIPVGQGRLCLSISGGNGFGRYNVPGGAFNSVGRFNAGGLLMNLVGTSTVGSGYDVPTVVPITGSPSIVAGSTWHFQLWHREAGGASNFSNGLSVNF